MAMFERDKMYGHRARIGYTSPPLTTEVFPYEFYKIVPDGVSLVITSLAIVVRSTAEVDQSYDISMRAAREMAAAGCDIVVLGGVPINLSRGFHNAQAMIDELDRDELEAPLNLSEGVVHVAQPEASLASIRQEIEGLDHFSLAALHVMTALTGSALLALAVLRGKLTPEQAWQAAHFDEDFQISQWGEDAEAKARREARWRDFQAAASMLDLLRD